mgnify:CR=1 FL=1
MTKNLHLCKKEIMEEIIRHIHIEMLQAHCDAQSYIDDYMFLTERLENVFPENRNVKLEVFLMLYCEEGEVKLELNNVARHLRANDLLISLPNTIIGQVMASPNHKVKVFCFSNRFIQRLTQTQKYSWKSICYIQENPIKHFGENRNETFHQYLKLIEDKIQTPPDKYQKRDSAAHCFSFLWRDGWLKPPEKVQLKKKSKDITLQSNNPTLSSSNSWKR